MLSPPVRLPLCELGAIWNPGLCKFKPVKPILFGVEYFASLALQSLAGLAMVRKPLLKELTLAEVTRHQFPLFLQIQLIHRPNAGERPSILTSISQDHMPNYSTYRLASLRRPPLQNLLTPALPRLHYNYCKVLNLSPKNTPKKSPLRKLKTQPNNQGSPIDRKISSLKQVFKEAASATEMVVQSQKFLRALSKQDSALGQIMLYIWQLYQSHLFIDQARLYKLFPDLPVISQRLVSQAMEAFIAEKGQKHNSLIGTHDSQSQTLQQLQLNSSLQSRQLEGVMKQLQDQYLTANDLQEKLQWLTLEREKDKESLQKLTSQNQALERQSLRLNRRNKDLIQINNFNANQLKGLREELRNIKVLPTPSTEQRLLLLRQALDRALAKLPLLIQKIQDTHSLISQQQSQFQQRVEEMEFQLAQASKRAESKQIKKKKEKQESSGQIKPREIMVCKGVISLGESISELHVFREQVQSQINSLL